jgi:hypothetical protein
VAKIVAAVAGRCHAATGRFFEKSIFSVFYEALRCNGVPVWMARMQASGVELGIASKER